VTPRVVLALAAVVLLLLPWPEPVSFAGFLTVGGVAAAVWTVRAPGSVAPLVLLAAAVGSWLSAVPEPSLLRVLAFGGAGYVVHSAAAMSAAVPAGAPVGSALLRHWAGTTVLTLGAGWTLVALTALLAGRSGSAALVVAGLLAAVTLVALPAVVLRWSRSRPRKS